MVDKRSDTSWLQEPAHLEDGRGRPASMAERVLAMLFFFAFTSLMLLFAAGLQSTVLLGVTIVWTVLASIILIAAYWPDRSET